MEIYYLNVKKKLFITGGWTDLVNAANLSIWIHNSLQDLF